MKSWWIRTRGGATDHDFCEVAVAVLVAGEVLLCVLAAALKCREFILRYRVEGATPGGIELFGVSNKLTTLAPRAAMFNGFKTDLLLAFAAGRITPVVGRVFGFAALPAAKNYMESDALAGRMIMLCA